MNFLRYFFGKNNDKIAQEAIQAYFNKLPSRIEVAWFREDGLIVGKILTDKNEEIYTQGRNPKEFVEMVNDSVYTAFDINPEYFEVMKSTSRSYQPPELEWNKLRNAKVEHSEFSLEKQLVAA